MLVANDQCVGQANFTVTEAEVVCAVFRAEAMFLVSYVFTFEVFGQSVIGSCTIPVHRKAPFRLTEAESASLAAATGGLRFSLL